MTAIDHAADPRPRLGAAPQCAGSAPRRQLLELIAHGRPGPMSGDTALADLGLDRGALLALLATVEQRWPHLAPLPADAVADRVSTLAELVDCLVRLDFSTLDLWRTDTWLT